MYSQGVLVKLLKKVAYLRPLFPKPYLLKDILRPLLWHIGLSTEKIHPMCFFQ